MQMKRHEQKTQPMASTRRRLGFMVGHGVASADLKRGFADDINAMFSCCVAIRACASTEPT